VPASRRSLLLPLLAAAVAFVLVLGAVVAVGLARRPDPAGGSFDAVPQEQPGPVVLVPGYGGSTVALEALAQRLRARGRAATVARLPGDGTGDLRASARALDAAVAAALAGGAPSVDLVGYSAGGVVVRLWVAEHDGARRARRVVTLGSPHHGTQVARLALSFAPDRCPEACRQLVPDSALLADLNDGDETPEGPGWASVWTDLDQVVTPPESARLEGASDVRLQTVCPDAATEHGTLPTDPLVVGVVLRTLGPGPLPEPPAAAECSALRAAGR